jgi:hypothetical protein
MRSENCTNAWTSAVPVPAAQRRRLFPWTWPGTPEEVWEYFQEVAVPFAPLLKSIPDEQRQEIDNEVLGAIGKYCDGASIKFTATVNITVAIR